MQDLEAVQEAAEDVGKGPVEDQKEGGKVVNLYGGDRVFQRPKKTTKQTCSAHRTLPLGDFSLNLRSTMIPVALRTSQKNRKTEFRRE
ncbi:hypothetical protein QR680_005461 [Steinernema hermaphroditum]|uniref:Uncharacterized protein n=1 Tax=Steinernema hermaphroditum TaxID=289476 RepID=A0AA39HS57_9BILA|nr:hypothetical protein QR680_005461 [Steinernema hermaphroditum]